MKTNSFTTFLIFFYIAVILAIKAALYSFVSPSYFSDFCIISSVFTGFSVISYFIYRSGVHCDGWKCWEPRNGYSPKSHYYGSLYIFYDLICLIVLVAKVYGKWTQFEPFFLGPLIAVMVIDIFAILAIVRYCDSRVPLDVIYSRA